MAHWVKTTESSLTTAGKAFRSSLKNPNLFLESGFIDGQHVRAVKGDVFEVTDPADGSLLGTSPDFDVHAFEAAVDLTAKAFESWKRSTPDVKAAGLLKWKRLCEENADDLALLITAENGKTLEEAHAELKYANSFLEWYAGEARRLYGDVIPSSNPTMRTTVIKQPVGTCAFITPWNFPIAMIAKKVTAATAAGCSSIIKPPPETPFSVVAYAVLAHQAGIPAGLINVVPTSKYTRDIGKAICTHPKIKKVSFTGSTPVGLLLTQMCAAAPTIRRISMELGGNAPFIVFDDADLSLAVTGLIAGKFRANGENCCAPNRILVQAGIYDAFVNALHEQMSKFVVGNGRTKGSTHGPLIHKVQRDKCARLVEDMRARGAQIKLGGNIPEDLPQDGAFYAPTLVVDATREMDFWKEEIFGPVAPVIKFETEEEALTWANDTDMGLACYFYTKDVSRCWRMSEELSYGMCGINSGLVSAAEAPFGGKNNSGFGKEGSKYGLDDYTDKKMMAWGGISSAF